MSCLRTKQLCVLPVFHFIERMLEFQAHSEGLSMLLPIIFISMLSSAALDDAVQLQVIDDIKEHIHTYYVDESSIAPINSSLSELSLLNILRETKSRKEFADTLSQHLETYDAHFSLQQMPTKTSVVKPSESWFAKLERKNFGITKVEVLDGNVGILDFWGFANATDDAKHRFTAAITIVSNVDALIIDLRNNGGGSGEMVQWLSSHLIAGKVHLNSFYTRHSNIAQEFWSDPDIVNPQLEQIPLFILVSSQTFSAAEEFAYNLKHLGRATIVGEQTKGGANPWRWFEIDHGFRLGVPLTKAINPVTKTNWEGKGVQPHIAVNAEGAFDLAYKQALHSLLSKEKNIYQRQEIHEQLILLESQ